LFGKAASTGFAKHLQRFRRDLEMAEAVTARVITVTCVLDGPRELVTGGRS
jgi:hypothetical protein